MLHTTASPNTRCPRCGRRCFALVDGLARCRRHGTVRPASAEPRQPASRLVQRVLIGCDGWESSDLASGPHTRSQRP